jgi:hypothetical protein
VPPTRLSPPVVHRDQRRLVHGDEQADVSAERGHHLGGVGDLWVVDPDGVVPVHARHARRVDDALTPSAEALAKLVPAQRRDRRRPVQLRVTGQHLPMQASQPRAWIDAELVGGVPGEVAVRRERVSRTPRAVEGQHQPMHGPFPVRVGCEHLPEDFYGFRGTVSRCQRLGQQLLSRPP